MQDYVRDAVRDHGGLKAAAPSNADHYKSRAVTEYKELPGRSHYTVGQEGWEEVADYALQWAVRSAGVARAEREHETAR